MEKAKRFAKSAVFGFSLVLLGWIVVQTSIKLVGFENAGSWWNFECAGPESAKVALNNGQGNTNFSSYYENLKTFPNLTAFLNSGEKQAKLTGPTDASSFSNQLKNLKEGEKLQFLAPVRVTSLNGTEDLYLPLLTAAMEGGNLNLDSTGEFWSLIQNEWASLKDTLGLATSTSDLLNQYLGDSSFTDYRELLGSNGDVLSSLDSNSDLSSLYGNLAQIIQDYQNSGDRTQDLSQIDLSSQDNLSELIALLGNSTSSQEQSDRIMSILTTETMKLASNLMVDKESAGDNLLISQASCNISGGEWVDNACKCPDQSVLGEDGSCHSQADLQSNCEKSGGSWQKVSEGYEPSPGCGLSGSILGILNANTNAARADLSQVSGDQNYCKCKSSSFCLDTNGVCRELGKDDDGDKIPNGLDRCPKTPAAEKDKVNGVKGGRYYGCSCSQIGAAPKSCPPDQCVGDNWAVYPHGKQECKNGKLLSYSCNPVKRSYDETCVNQNKLAQGDENNNYNVNDNWNYFQGQNSGSTTTNSNSNSSKNAMQSSKPGTGGKSLNRDDFSKSPPGPNVPSGTGNSGWNTERGLGRVEDIKKALKRIHDVDPLRYEMIFRSVKTIARTSFPGGLCYGCGYIEVSASLNIGIMDQVIVHESTHAGHACTVGWGGFSTGQVERIACANQMGSLCRADGHQDMREFPGQKEGVDFLGKKIEVRGYISRRETMVDPKGDLGTAAYHWPISYAYSYGNTTMGPYHYGEHASNLILGLTANEENVVKRTMEFNRPCLSKPTSDLPPVEACQGGEGVAPPPDIQIK